jgi:tRNA(Ile)-lysidine synthase
VIDLEAWSNRCTFPAAGTAFRCGVSGGADSLALLALATNAGCDVTAVHVDHGQRSGGGVEAASVAARAAQVGARFEAVTVDVLPGPNLEARMRAARYVALGPDAATGHTADDQAETVLINLIRGAGLVGLGAMQPGHRRPILALRRCETEAVCATLGWEPFTDPSNAETRFLRNRVRHEVLPLLNDIADRDVVPLLVRSADHAREAADLLDERVDQIDPTDARALANAPRPIAARAIQRWVRAETGDEHPIDAAAIGRVLEVASGATTAAEVHGGWRVSRSQQRLTVSAIIRPA